MRNKVTLAHGQVIVRGKKSFNTEGTENTEKTQAGAIEKKVRFLRFSLCPLC